MITIPCPKCGELIVFSHEAVESEYVDGITWEQLLAIHCDKCGSDIQGRWFWRLDKEDIKWDVTSR